jgi:hypothetical protein
MTSIAATKLPNSMSASQIDQLINYRWSPEFPMYHLLSIKLHCAYQPAAIYPLASCYQHTDTQLIEGEKRHFAEHLCHSPNLRASSSRLQPNLSSHLQLVTYIHTKTSRVQPRRTAPNILRSLHRTNATARNLPTHLSLDSLRPSLLLVSSRCVRGRFDLLRPEISFVPHLVQIDK